MAQAVKLSEVENGDKVNWDCGESSRTQTQDFFDKYLSKYIQYYKYDTPITNNGIFWFKMPDGSAFGIRNCASCIFDVYYLLNANDRDRLVKDTDAWNDSVGKKFYV